MEPERHVVTGAFGFTGRYITARLLAEGKRVVTLTGHPQRPSPFGDRVTVAPFDFDDPAALAETLRGARVLYNTYWVRFDRGGESYERAVANTRALIRAAEQAGIRRLVHVSITNPSEKSKLAYFRGKALLEREISAANLTHAILRPAVLFGPEDVLINNIAWIVRRAPFFVVPGSGDYGLQPIFVEDLAALAVDAGGGDSNTTIDAVGPETFRFEELVRLIARTIGRRPRIIHASPRTAYTFSRLLGRVVRDVVLTRDELDGLMENLLVSTQPPTGQTRLSDWLRENADTVGRRYASELARHYRRSREPTLSPLRRASGRVGETPL